MVRLGLIFGALLLAAATAAAQDDAEARFRAAAAPKGDDAKNGFAFVADLKITVTGLGESAVLTGTGDYDPRRPAGERWVVTAVTALDADGQPFEDAEDQADAEKQIREAFNANLSEIGLDLKEHLERGYDFALAGERVTYKVAPDKDFEKPLRRRAENTRWTMTIEDGCPTRIEGTLEDSYKPSIAARINKQNRVFTHVCPADMPAHRTSLSNDTAGEAVGNSFMSTLEAKFSNVVYVGPPADAETAASP